MTTILRVIWGIFRMPVFTRLTRVMKCFLKQNTTGKQQKPRGRKQHPKLFALASLGGPSSEEAKGSTQWFRSGLQVPTCLEKFPLCSPSRRKVTKVHQCLYFYKLFLYVKINIKGLQASSPSCLLPRLTQYLTQIVTISLINTLISQNQYNFFYLFYFIYNCAEFTVFPL